jgi:sugar phosphate isomerase/epimerase
MKIAFSTFACPDWTLDEVLVAASRYRYDGVEFRCDANQQHFIEVFAPKDERELLRRKLDASNVEGCCLATSLQFAKEGVMEELLPRLELAADMGIPALRVLCGPRPNWMSMPDFVSYVASQLRQAASVAETIGVQLWLETHDTLSLAADCAAVVRRTDRELVGITYNTLHPYRNGEPLDRTFAAMGNLIRFTHFNDGVAQRDKVIVRPIGQGDLPMGDIFRALVNSGYDGYLCGQWFHDQYGPTPEDALEAYYNEVVELAFRQGMTIGVA